MAQYMLNNRSMENNYQEVLAWEKAFARYIDALKAEDKAYATKRLTGRVAHMRTMKALKALSKLDQRFVHYVL
jgi:hypothetical protein